MNNIEVVCEGILLSARPVLVLLSQVVAIMTEPKDLSGIVVSTRAIPAFAMCCCRDLFIKGGVLTDEPVLTDEALIQLHDKMIGLYKAHCKLLKRTDEIRESLADLYKAMDPCFKSENVISNEEFYKLRSELRKKLKNGNITNKEYAKKLAILKENTKKLDSIISHIEESITMIMQYMISDDIDHRSLLQLIAKYGIWTDRNFINKYTETIKNEIKTFY